MNRSVKAFVIRSELLLPVSEICARARDDGDASWGIVVEVVVVEVEVVVVVEEEVGVVAWLAWLLQPGMTRPFAKYRFAITLLPYLTRMVDFLGKVLALHKDALPLLSVRVRPNVDTTVLFVFATFTYEKSIVTFFFAHFLPRLITMWRPCSWDVETAMGAAPASSWKTKLGIKKAVIKRSAIPGFFTTNTLY